MTLRPDRFCNFVYTWAVERVENRDEFDTNLLEPLPGTRRKAVKPSAVEVEREGEDFMSFMSAVNG